MWRKQATISVQDEFSEQALPPGLEDSLPATLEDLFSRTRAGVRRSAELYINVCHIMDRLVKRTEGVAADHARIAMSLTSLTESSADTYATDTNEVPLLNDGLAAMSKHLSTYQTLLEDEGRGWDEGVLEDLKRQRDSLVSVRELFDRRDKLDRDTIPYLERRIQTNETRLTNLRAKPEGLVKPGEIEKVAEAIIKVRTRASAAAAGSFVSSLFSCQLLFRCCRLFNFQSFLLPAPCSRTVPYCASIRFQFLSLSCVVYEVSVLSGSFYRPFHALPALPPSARCHSASCSRYAPVDHLIFFFSLPSGVCGNAQFCLICPLPPPTCSFLLFFFSFFVFNVVPAKSCPPELTKNTGQGIHRAAAQPIHLCQGVPPRRAPDVPVDAVPRQSVEPGLGRRAGQVRGDAGRQLAPAARRARGHAPGRLSGLVPFLLPDGPRAVSTVHQQQ